MKTRSVCRLIPNIRYILYSMFFLTLASSSLCKGSDSNPPDSLRVNESSGQFKITEIATLATGVHGLAVDKEGVIYFADTYSKLDDVSRVYRLKPPYTGTPQSTKIEGVSIAGLMWLNDRLYVAFLNKNEVVIYDRELEFLESRPVNSPLNFATDGDKVYVLSYFGNIGLITNSRVKIHMEGLSVPFDIQYSGNESLWVSQQSKEDASGKVSEIAYEGVIINTLQYRFKSPAGLSMDPDGNLYIADQGDNKIYRTGTKGEISLISDQYDSPRCVAQMPDGRMLVSTDHKGGVLLLVEPVR